MMIPIENNVPKECQNRSYTGNMIIDTEDCDGDCDNDDDNNQQ